MSGGDGIYRKIYVSMHGDARYRRLSPMPPSGQSLWFHLLAGEPTGAIPGVLCVGRAAFAEMLRWPVEGFDLAFAEVYREGMAKADWDARMIWVPHAIDHNPPQSKNVIKAWVTAWPLVPECALKVEAYRALRAYLVGKSQAFLQAFDEGIAYPEAETEAEAEAGGGRAPAREEHHSLSPPTRMPSERSTTRDVMAQDMADRAGAREGTEPVAQIWRMYRDALGTDPGWSAPAIAIAHAVLVCQHQGWEPVATCGLILRWLQAERPKWPALTNHQAVFGRPRRRTDDLTELRLKALEWERRSGGVSRAPYVPPEQTPEMLAELEAEREADRAAYRAEQAAKRKARA